MFDNVRRVVTVIGEDGVSRIASDGVPPVARRLPNAGASIDEVWRFDALPGDIHAPGDPAEFSFLSPPNGFLVRRVEVPPDATRFVDDAGNPREPGPDEGMHQTPQPVQAPAPRAPEPVAGQALWSSSAWLPASV